MANEFEKVDTEKILFGISVVALKQLRYKDALSSINELIHKFDIDKKKILPVYFYIRALCHKELGNHREAK